MSVTRSIYRRILTAMAISTGGYFLIRELIRQKTGQSTPLMLQERKPTARKTTAPRAQPSKPRQKPGRTPITKDDLTKIDGIGPKSAAVLDGSGIESFSQLANTKAENLKEILKSGNIRITNTETWQEQAKFAAAGDLEGLEKFLDKRKADRK